MCLPGLLAHYYFEGEAVDEVVACCVERLGGGVAVLEGVLLGHDFLCVCCLCVFGCGGRGEGEGVGEGVCMSVLVMVGRCWERLQQTPLFLTNMHTNVAHERKQHLKRPSPNTSFWDAHSFWCLSTENFLFLTLKISYF